MNNSDFRVIHGTIEIGNQMHTITEGLKKIGVNARTLNYYPNYLGFQSDYILDVNSFKDINKANAETRKIAAKLISENNVFHFHFGTSLTLDHSDFDVLKRLNKKVIMHHWGSEIRMLSVAKKINPYVRVKILDEDNIKRSLEFMAKRVNCCIVADEELYYYVKDFYKKVVKIPQAINLNKYKIPDTNSDKNKKFLIVHAPTHRQVKGTEFVIKAIQNLMNKYDFEFKLVENLSHEEAKKIYEQADLIIDQLCLGAYGLLSLECMAMGKPVVCWISDFMKSHYPKDLPIISVSPDKIETKLEFILNNKDMLQDIGLRGRKYVEKYHDSITIAKKVLEVYKQ